MCKDISVLKYEDKELKEIFAIIVDTHPGLSSYICFAKAIHSRKYSEGKISIWFNKLVDKDDYQKSDKERLLKYLYNHTNSTR